MKWEQFYDLLRSGVNQSFFLPLFVARWLPTLGGSMALLPATPCADDQPADSAVF